MTHILYKIIFSLFIILVPAGALLSNNYSKDYQKQADSVLSTLSIRQKVAQLFIIDFVSTNSQKIKEMQDQLVEKDGVGGLITMNDNLSGAVNRLNRLHKLAKVPLLVSIDGEWGISMRYKEIPAFQRQMQLGALSNDSLVYKMAKAIGQECRDLNIHINFAPDVDINNNPNNPAINTRSFGEDKIKVALYGAAYVQGMKDAGVAGSAKHFPGHGDTNIDSHKGLPILPFSKERLDSLELFPFRYLIDVGVDMVMVGHLQVPIYDSSKRPASISKNIITGLLRDKLDYKGIICTDALNMDGVAKSCGLEKKDIPYEAYKAGADILLMAENVHNAISLIANKVEDGELSQDDLDARVKKILLLKARMGLFNKGYKPFVNNYKLGQKLIKQENIDLINKISRNTITLLWNNRDTSINYVENAYLEPLSEREDDFVGDKVLDYLPLSNLNKKKIALVILEEKNKSSLMGDYLNIYRHLDTIVRVPYATWTVNYPKLALAKEKLKSYDLILTSFENTDSRPSKNFGVDTQQMNFFNNWAAEQDMIVLYFGSPYALNKFTSYDNFKAFILAYSNTKSNLMAATQAVFGAIPCLGTLPVSAGKFLCNSSVILNNTVRPLFNLDDVLEKQIYKDSILLSKMSLPITIFPIIAKLIDNGEFKITSFIKDILSPSDRLTVLDASRRRNKEQSSSFVAEDIVHGNIILWDLMSQHSGLPAVDNNFIYNKQNLKNLILLKGAEPVYSNVNAFYLYKIIDKYYPNAKEEIISSTNNIFDKLEMCNSFIDDNLGVHTNLCDLQKLVYAVNNNGKYAQEQVFSKAAASLIQKMLQYYFNEYI